VVSKVPDNRKTESIIDTDVALTFTAGNRDMLISVAQLFLEEGPRQLQAVQSCIAAGDAAGTRKAAHTLKGSVVIFGANKAAAAADQVQHAATDEDLSRVPHAWNVLNREMERLFCEVQELCSD
jgi:HPt (histidine-containing phosphotransfer) domain-containing protein